MVTARFGRISSLRNGPDGIPDRILLRRAVRERVFGRMDEAAAFGVFAWSFSGGEPLMNPNMPDYIEYASRKGFFTSMPTNGLALKKYAESCVKLDQLEVSIDTLDREKFARRRGIDGLPVILNALD